MKKVMAKHDLIMPLSGIQVLTGRKVYPYWDVPNGIALINDEGEQHIFEFEQTSFDFAEYLELQ